MKYERGPQLYDGHIPKPRRKKSRPGAWRRAKISYDADGKVVVNPRHDDVLNACIDIVEAHGLAYLHVPNELYRLCAIPNPYHPDDLAYVFERQLGLNNALNLKRILMSAFKGVIDLIVWAPIGDGINLSLQGDVKIGPDKLNHAQKEWGKLCSIREWRTVDDFKMDFDYFLKQANGIKCSMENNKEEKSIGYNMGNGVK